MRYNSLAFSLTYIKYKEHSIISKLFTREMGVQSFIVNGVRKKNSKKNLNFFKPLQLLNICGVYSNKNGLQRLEDISYYKNHFLENKSMYNRFVEMFISDVLAKTLKENQQEVDIFNYILKIKKDLDGILTPNYSINFLINLSSFFGFLPSNDNDSGIYFDLDKGVFVDEESSTTINGNLSSSLKELILNPNASISYTVRNELLHLMIKYFKCQNHEIKNLNSHLIFESLRI